MSTAVRSSSLLLWPFLAVWALVTFVLRAIGRGLCGLLGLVVMATGIALCFTLVGIIVGAPLASLGLLLLARAVF